MCISSSTSSTPEPSPLNSPRPITVTTSENIIYSIPSRPSRPEESNIDEPAPLQFRKLVRVPNSKGILLEIPITKPPLQPVLGALEDYASRAEELAEIEAEVAVLNNRVAKAKAVMFAAAALAKTREQFTNMKLTFAVPDRRPPTGRGREESITKVGAQEYIPSQNSFKDEDYTSLKRWAMYDPNIPTQIYRERRDVVPGPFDDITEEIYDRLEELKRKGAKKWGSSEDSSIFKF